MFLLTSRGSSAFVFISSFHPSSNCIIFWLSPILLAYKIFLLDYLLSGSNVLLLFFVSMLKCYSIRRIAMTFTTPVAWNSSQCVVTLSSLHREKVLRWPLANFWVEPAYVDNAYLSYRRMRWDEKDKRCSRMEIEMKVTMFLFSEKERERDVKVILHIRLSWRGKPVWGIFYFFSKKSFAEKLKGKAGHSRTYLGGKKERRREGWIRTQLNPTHCPHHVGSNCIKELLFLLVYIAEVVGEIILLNCSRETVLS